MRAYRLYYLRNKMLRTVFLLFLVSSLFLSGCAEDTLVSSEDVGNVVSVKVKQGGFGTTSITTVRTTKGAFTIIGLHSFFYGSKATLNKYKGYMGKYDDGYAFFIFVDGNRHGYRIQ